MQHPHLRTIKADDADLKPLAVATTSTKLALIFERELDHYYMTSKRILFLDYI